MQRYTVYYIWKLLHMFWVVPAAIAEELELVAGSSNGVTNTRCYRYSCMRSS